MLAWRSPGSSAALGDSLQRVAREWLHGRGVDQSLVHLIKIQIQHIAMEGDFDAAVLTIAFERLLGSGAR
jgi:hypothetical protein